MATIFKSSLQNLSPLPTSLKVEPLANPKTGLKFFVNTTKTKVLAVFGENLETKVSTLFVYLGFYVAFNTVQVISRRVVGRAEETSTYSSLGFCTVNCRPMASNYQLSHLRP